jgi:hypothetical protein
MKLAQLALNVQCMDSGAAVWRSVSHSRAGSYQELFWSEGPVGYTKTGCALTPAAPKTR